MRQSSVLILVALVMVGVILISACSAFEDPSQRATENAQNTALWTMAYGIQTQMPTMEAMQQTADSAVFLSTQLAQTNIQNDALRATNSALLANPPQQNQFSPPTAIGGGQPAGSLPTADNSQVNANATIAAAGSGNNTTDNTTGNNNTASGGSSTVGNTRYTETVTATSIDDATGCPAGPSNSFNQATESIYFGTRALGVEPGTSFSLRVRSGDSIVASDPNFWTPDESYDDTCIWYNIDRSTMVFNAGTYTVELLANDVIATSTTFVISGSGDDMQSDDMS